MRQEVAQQVQREDRKPAVPRLHAERSGPELQENRHREIDDGDDGRRDGSRWRQVCFPGISEESYRSRVPTPGRSRPERTS